MPYKTCPSCQQTSYSACVSSIWLCPYCGKELTLCQALYDHRRLSAVEAKTGRLPVSLYLLK